MNDVLQEQEKVSRNGGAQYDLVQTWNRGHPLKDYCCRNQDENARAFKRKDKCAGQAGEKAPLLFHHPLRPDGQALHAATAAHMRWTG
jgi:hypothetical protein